MNEQDQEKTLRRRIRDYCEANQAQYVLSVNQDFDKALVRGPIGFLFVLGSSIVALACYLNMGETWLLLSHSASSLFLLSSWLIFPRLPIAKRASILWFDLTLLIMLIEIHFIIGAYWRLAPESLSENATLGFDLFVYLCMSVHPSRRYRIVRDGFFISGNILVIVLHNPKFSLTIESVIPFLRFALIYALLGIAIASMINFYGRFRFYFDFVSRTAKIHAYQQMGKLLYRHQIADIECGSALEETMPVGTSKAAVICFDVQNSTALGHNRSHLFFESVNKKSYELMIKRYDEHARISDAFLIKEMGDGFLCSVGFPFQSPGVVQEQAVLLAEQFIQLFQAEAARFFPSQQVLCSVGIAFGEVTGKFPTIGVRGYELFGDAIVKATRYEGMRKILFQEFGIEPGHILTLQSDVFPDLPPSLQKRFQRIELGSFHVRDDAAATHLFCNVQRPWEELRTSA